jgi:hypothetical protein
MALSDRLLTRPAGAADTRRTRTSCGRPEPPSMNLHQGKFSFIETRRTAAVSMNSSRFA